MIHLTRQHKKALIICGLITLATLAVMLIYKNLEWEEKIVDRGYSPAALKNNFLAAELFLRKQGVRTTSAKNFILLDKFSWRNTPLGDKDTIILINGHKTLTKTRYDNLIKWVENGGTLITSTQNPFIGDHTKAHDILLEDFNIELAHEIEENEKDKRTVVEKIADELKKSPRDEKPKNTEEKASDDKVADKKTTDKKSEKAKSDKFYRCNKDETPAEITFNGEDKPLLFDFSLNSAFNYYRNDEDEPEFLHMAYFDIGEGSVTVTSDNTIWRNQRIDCYDHAYGLWRLINPEGRVWFLVNQDAPSLWSILWRSAHHGVIAAIVALCLWLWQKSLRFGPLLAREHIERRSLAEHIYSSGMLLWRKQQHPQLIVPLRQDVMERLNQYHPHIMQSSRAEQLSYLHQLTQLSTADIQQALFADNLLNPQAFTTAVAHLQTIRKAL